MAASCWNRPTAEFRIDHDQKFNPTTNLQYTSTKRGAWAALSWRYDSGLVAGAVPEARALALTGDQQARDRVLLRQRRWRRAISPITEGSRQIGGAKRMNIPAEGTEDDVTNPPRIAPRHLVDLGFGVDNLLPHRQGQAPSCASAC